MRLERASVRLLFYSDSAQKSSRLETQITSCFPFSKPQIALIIALNASQWSVLHSTMSSDSRLLSSAPSAVISVVVDQTDPELPCLREH